MPAFLPPFPRDRAGGFVLLELMLALAILALLAALALPRARFAEDHLGLKAQEIAVLLRRDRDEALRGQRAVRTEIALGDHAVRSGAANGAVPVPPSVALRYAGRGPAIRFAPDGSAQGGTILLAAPTGEVVAVAVDDLTGAVTVNRGAGHAP